MLIGLNRALHRHRVLLWIVILVCGLAIAFATSHPHGAGADADAPGQHSIQHELCGLGEVLCAVALLVGLVFVAMRRLRGPPWEMLAVSSSGSVPIDPPPRFLRAPSLLALGRSQR